MSLATHIFSIVLALQAWRVYGQPLHADAPLVRIANGTLQGYHSSHYRQDFFLGIPYASAPVGNLRFRRPTPATAWNGTKMAATYAPWCLGNSVGLPGFSQPDMAIQSEDCLHLNIIRPTGLSPASRVPVLVWIPGGGWNEGSAADQRYNGSFLVQTSVELGSPIVFVSFNYRLGIFGTIAGPVIEKDGLTNLLLHDQRQALRWIQENISNFGGDPDLVTIMGESAGALSIGYHLIAHGGRDDRLFRAAIAESGGPFNILTPLRPISERSSDFQVVLNTTGCVHAEDALGCLREAPAELINLSSQLIPRYFTIDGDLLEDDNFSLLEQNRFVKVPLLIGSNRNEGASFVQQRMTGPLNGFGDFSSFVQKSLGGRPVTDSIINSWAKLYWREINQPTEAGLGPVSANPGPLFGPWYGMTTLWMGDMMFTAGRRFANKKWAANNLSTYGYFFEATNTNINRSTLGVAHFQEIPYVFGNMDGTGWAMDPFPLHPTHRSRHQSLAHLMSRMWISFTATGNPNLQNVPNSSVVWPLYSNSQPANLAFNLLGSSVQPDTWRDDAINMFFDVAKAAAAKVALAQHQT